MTCVSHSQERYGNRVEVRFGEVWGVRGDV